MSKEFAAVKPKHSKTPIDPADDIPFQHFKGSGKPKHMQCTCAMAPTRYCWKCKTYAQPSEIFQPHEDPRGQGKIAADEYDEFDQSVDEGAIDLWDDPASEF